jgi:hypothetical protein
MKRLARATAKNINTQESPREKISLPLFWNTWSIWASMMACAGKLPPATGQKRAYDGGLWNSNLQEHTRKQMLCTATTTLVVL